MLTLSRTNSTNCGLDGDRCRPFDNSSFAFYCPADCGGVKVLETHFIGAQEINYRNLVIGGPTNVEHDESSIYRGDSFICPAAIHAGITNDRNGGCGILSRIGEQSNYPNVDRNGISSVGFPSNFP